MFNKELACGPSPSIANGSKNTTATEVGTHVLYKCHYGHHFETEIYSMVIHCTEHATWSIDESLHCHGMLICVCIFYKKGKS